MSEVIPDISVSNETSLDSVGSMLVNVFVSPMRVFQRLKVKSTWIVPFIIFILATTATSYVIAPLAMETQKQEIKTSEKLSQEQKDAALQQMETYAGIGVALGVVGGLVGGAIMVFLSAGIVMFMGTVFFTIWTPSKPSCSASARRRTCPARTSSIWATPCRTRS